jgi:hypothetical protein
MIAEVQRIPALELGQVYRFDAELHDPPPPVAKAFLDHVERSLLR